MKKRDTKIMTSFVFVILTIICGRVIAYKLNVNNLMMVAIPLIIWFMMGIGVFSKKTSRVICKESLKKYVIRLALGVACVQVIIISMSLYLDSRALTDQIRFSEISIISMLFKALMIGFREGVRHYVIHGVNRNNTSKMVIWSAIGIAVSELNIDVLFKCQSFQAVFLFISLSVLPLVLTNLFISYLVWLNGAIEGIIYSSILSVLMFVSVPLVSITTGVMLIMPVVSLLIVEKCYEIKVEKNWCKSKNKTKLHKNYYQYSIRQPKLV